MTGILYIVGTPIGNLSDFSARAVETLQQVDFIAAEDTRVTLKLLNHFGIKKPLVSYHEHNLRERGEQVVARLLEGQNGAIVSDAGMPCISDPGEDLVKLAAKRGIPTQVVPGPSAVISALCLSGLSTSRFAFEGFLSTNKQNRRRHLESVKHDTHTLVFYEAPHKLLTTLTDMRDVLGEERRISLVREMTKIHEEVRRATLGEAVAYYTQNPPKGEFVLVIEGVPEPELPEVSLEEAVEEAQGLVREGMRAADAAKQVSAHTPFRKSELYSQLIENAKDCDDAL